MNTNTDGKSEYWNELFYSTIEKLDKDEARKIMDIVYDMSNDQKLKNIGLKSGRELITALGVFLAKHDVEGGL